MELDSNSNYKISWFLPVTVDESKFQFISEMEKIAVGNVIIVVPDVDYEMLVPTIKMV